MEIFGSSGKCKQLHVLNNFAEVTCLNLNMFTLTAGYAKLRRSNFFPTVVHAQ